MTALPTGDSNFSDEEEGSLHHLVDKSTTTNLYYALISFNFIGGLYLSGVTSLFPEMEEALDISNSVLGDLIATSIVGISSGIYFSPYILADIGSANSALYSTLVAAAGLVLYGYASVFGQWLLILGINIIGFAFVWLMGACNTQVSLLEVIDNKHYFGMMQGVHAIGILSGALIAAGMSQMNVGIYYIDIIFAVSLVAVVLIPFPIYLRQDIELRLELYREEKKDSRHNHNLSNSTSRRNLFGHDSNSEDDHDSNSELQKDSSFKDNIDIQENEASSLLCLDHDKEKRPLLRSRNTTNSAKATNASSSKLNNASKLNNNNNNSGSNNSAAEYGTVSSLLSSNAASVGRRDLNIFWLLNIIMVCAGLGSGVALSWSEIYVLQDWLTSETIATLGYVGFQLGAATSRFITDGCILHYGHTTIILFGCVGAALGTLVSALACLSRNESTLVIAVTGFVLTGFCFGPIYPAVLSYASQLPGFATSEVLPVVKASTLIAGMVIAPLLYGNIIDVIGYMSSFLIQVVIYAIGAVCAWYLPAILSAKTIVTSPSTTTISNNDVSTSSTASENKQNSSNGIVAGGSSGSV